MPVGGSPSYPIEAIAEQVVVVKPSVPWSAVASTVALWQIRDRADRSWPADDDHRVRSGNKLLNHPGATLGAAAPFLRPRLYQEFFRSTYFLLSHPP